MILGAVPRVPAVRTLQAAVNRLGLDRLVVDGIVGPKTLAAVNRALHKVKAPLSFPVSPDQIRLNAARYAGMISKQPAGPVAAVKAALTAGGDGLPWAQIGLGLAVGTAGYFLLGSKKARYRRRQRKSARRRDRDLGKRLSDPSLWDGPSRRREGRESRN